MPAALAAETRRPSNTATPLVIDESVRAVFARNRVATLEDLCALADATSLEKATLPSWRRRIAIRLQTDDGPRTFYVKHFERPPVSAQLRRIASGHAFRSTAGIERHWIQSLESAGIAVPGIAAFAERKRGPWERSSVIVLREVDGLSLEKWFIDHPQRAPRVMQTELAGFVARFHDRGFTHRDLYAAHIFLESGNAQAPRFRLIDLQRILYKPWRRRRWRVKDLAQLNYSTPTSVATRSDRIRWLKHYLGVRRLDQGEHRELVAKVLIKTARIAAHDRQRRGRSVTP